MTIEEKTILYEYDKISNNIFQTLLDSITEAFINYYGENYREKITKRIHDTLIITFTLNESKDSINEKIKILNSYLKKERNRENIIGLKLQLGYELLKKNKKINDTDPKIVLKTFLKNKNLFNSSKIEKIKTTTREDNSHHLGYAISINTRSDGHYYIGLNSVDRMNVCSLIHEISHILQMEELALAYDENNHDIGKVKNSNITNDNEDLVNEIINDKITLDIFNIWQKKYKNEFSDWVIYDYSTDYLILDELFNNIISKLYELLKDIIKDNFLKDNLNIVEKIIGSDNYEFLYEILKIIYQDIAKLKVSSFEEYRSLKKETIDKCNKKCEEIYLETIKNIEEYKEYNKNINMEVENMIQNGSAHRMK